MDLRKKRPPKDFFKFLESENEEEQGKRKRQVTNNNTNKKRQITVNAKTNKKRPITVNCKTTKKRPVTVKTKTTKRRSVTVNAKTTKKSQITVNTKTTRKRKITVNTKTNKKQCKKEASDKVIPTKVFENNTIKIYKPGKRQKRNIFHCKTSYCDGRFAYDPGVVQFLCSICRHINCIDCQAVHEGLDCLAYQQLKLNENKEIQINEDLQNEKQTTDKEELQMEVAASTSFDHNVEDILIVEELTVAEKSEHLSLLELEDADGPVPNPDLFNCPVCYLDVEPQEGIILRECLHCLCIDCFINSVKYSDEPEVKCPFDECEGIFQHREMRAVVPTELFEAHLSKIYKQVESQTRNSFHCQTANCDGWSEYDVGVREFLCPICHHRNCISCQAVHEGSDCLTFQKNKLNNTQENQSLEALQEQLEKGEAMKCPGCQMIVTKNGGCDAMVCWVCRMELCWATKGARWGPQGRGDRSGGCHCNENGQKCHPGCRNCH